MANPSTMGYADAEPVETPVGIDNLAAKLQAQFATWKDARSDIEDQWIKDLRQFMGVHDPDTLAKIRTQQNKKSELYIGLTRTKVMAAYSKIIDLLFQTGEQPYSIEPTPVPNIPGFKQLLQKKALTDLMLAAQTSDPMLVADLIDQRKEEIEAEIEREAKKRSKKMQKQINDQTAEANFERKLKEAIFECCILGSGAFKSGTTVLEKEAHWMTGEGEDGNFVTAVAIEEKGVPELEAVSVFDLYPDPYSTDNTDSNGIYRRHVLTRHQLRKLKNSPGFNDDAIDSILLEMRGGNHIEEDHETTRRTLGLVENTSVQSNRYEVLEFWGYVDGQDLMDCGVEKIKEEHLTVELQANVWICSGKVLKAQLNPLPKKNIPYTIVPYERMPGQLWGVSIPRMMRDSQMTMNAAVRMMVDNAAISSGPLIEVNADLLAAGEDPTNVYPWRVFVREGGDPNSPMVRFYQPQSNQKELGNIIELFKRFADETTSLPSYTHGMQSDSLNATATGMSMLMGAANINLKSVIKNIDDFLIGPIIQNLYDWNMEWGEDDEIKGDMKIVTRGSTALIQKEIQSQRLMQFMSIAGATPAAGAVDWIQLLRDAAKSMDMDSERVIPKSEGVPPPGMVPMGNQQVMPANGAAPPEAMPMPAPPPPDMVAAGRGANGGFSNA